MSPPNEIYKIEDYIIDFGNQTVSKGKQNVDLRSGKMFEVLYYLIKNNEDYLSVKDIKEGGWSESYIADSSVYNSISIINDAIKFEGENFIYNERNRGYRIGRKIELIDNRNAVKEKANVEKSSKKLTVKPSLIEKNSKYILTELKKAETSYKKNTLLLIVLGIVIIFSLVIIYFFFYENTLIINVLSTLIVGGVLIVYYIILKLEIDRINKERIKYFVKESQNMEFTFYVKPELFSLELAHNYFIPEEKGGKNICDIKEKVDELKTQQHHYDEKTRNVFFRITSCKLINKTTAKIKSIEEWRAKKIDKNGNVIDIPDLAYEPTYIMKKVDENWLVKENTTPYKKTELKNDQ